MAKASKKKANIPEGKEPLIGCDFCMQFDYDEPHVIGASPDEHGAIELVIKSYLDAGVTFVCPTTGKKLINKGFVSKKSGKITKKGRKALKIL